MPVEVGGIKLHRVHKIVTLEQGAFVYHRIPGLEGNVVQVLGRDSVRLQIEGIFYGSEARLNLLKQGPNFRDFFFMGRDLQPVESGVPVAVIRLHPDSFKNILNRPAVTGFHRIHVIQCLEKLTEKRRVRGGVLIPIQ